MTLRAQVLHLSTLLPLVFLALQVGAELGGGEVVEGAQAFVEFGGGEAAIAVERAEIVRGGVFFLCGVAHMQAETRLR